MKQATLLICLCALLLSGCLSPKKIASSATESAASSEKQSEAASSEAHSFTDAAKKSDVEVSYFKIEFYPPAEMDGSPSAAPDDAALPESPLTGVGCGDLKNSPRGKAAIKSIEVYTAKAKSEEAGVSESEASAHSSWGREESEDVNRHTEAEEQPSADPYRWRYIFWIVLVLALAAAGIYFWLRKSKLFVSIALFLKNLF
ncbi:MAG: hypothetical protein LBJ57_03995 [Prevotellaceae bacterium]|jgi:cobalamin biosynthesis Mg chelatase CobN|nr:hypothetical protein [Prevotellaceae bacterium]